MNKLNQEIQNIIDSPIIDNFYNLNIDKKNLILYGFGKLGKMAIELLSTVNIQPKYIVDKNTLTEINFISIIKPHQIRKVDLESSIFINCISSISYNEINSYLKSLGCIKIIHFYDLAYMIIPNILSNGWEKFQVNETDTENINYILTKLNHDIYSKKHYLQFLWWRIRRKETIHKNFPVLSSQKYFDAPCFPKLTNNERLLDSGAHHGTTIKHFLKSTNNNFDTIWAFEPDQKNLSILNNSLDLNIKNKINIYDIALSNTETTFNFMDSLGFASKLDKSGQKQVKVKRIDDLDLNPTIIKLHLEGYELHALEGAKDTIMKSRPIIMVLADHNEDGLYKIANLLISFKEYKLFFYLHDYCGNSAIFYAIPKERIC